LSEIGLVEGVGTFEVALVDHQYDLARERARGDRELPAADVGADSVLLEQVADHAGLGRGREVTERDGLAAEDAAGAAGHPPAADVGADSVLLEQVADHAGLGRVREVTERDGLAVGRVPRLVRRKLADEPDPAVGAGLDSLFVLRLTLRAERHAVIPRR